MRNSKRGQGLPLTTIIIAILVVVVLVVIVAFFLGGSTALTDTIKRVFFGTTAGYDLALAIETCNSRCSIAQGMPAVFRGQSAYCKTSMAVDKNPVDGEADYTKDGTKKVTKKYFCPSSSSYDPDQTTTNLVGFMDIGCDLGNDETGTKSIECEFPEKI